MSKMSLSYCASLLLFVSVFIFVQCDNEMNKINCKYNIDSAVMAYDLIPQESYPRDQIYIFSNKYYYHWNVSSKQITYKGEAAKKWPDLPPTINSACAFRIPSTNVVTYVFVKDNRVWRYEGAGEGIRKVLENQDMSRVFQYSLNDQRCMACYDIGNGVDVIQVQEGLPKLMSNVWINNRLEERGIISKSDFAVSRISEKSGKCQALVAYSAGPVLHLFYFGEEKIEINGLDQFESPSFLRREFIDRADLVECRTLFGEFKLWVYLVAIIVGVVILFIVILVCFSKFCGSKDDDDESDYDGEKTGGGSPAESGDSNIA